MLSALRREGAIYRRALETALAVAIERVFVEPDDALAYRIIEIVSEVLGKRQRPAHAGGADAT